MLTPRRRICTDYSSTKDFFTYLLVYAPNLPADDNWTFQDAFSDFRQGVIDSLESAHVPEQGDERNGLISSIDEAYKLSMEDNVIPACNLLQNAEKVFTRLCLRRRKSAD